MSDWTLCADRLPPRNAPVVIELLGGDRLVATLSWNRESFDVTSSECPSLLLCYSIKIESVFRWMPAFDSFSLNLLRQNCLTNTTFRRS